MTRKEQILKAAEFDIDLYPKHGCDLSQGRRIGAVDEHTRLRPLLYALIDRIEQLEGALEDIIDADNTYESKTWDIANACFATPTALDALLKGDK